MYRDNTGLRGSSSNLAMSIAVLACLVAATPVQGQYRGPPPGHGPPDGVSGPGSASNGDIGRPDGALRDGVAFDVNKATHYRTIHGILAATAFVILFPVGAMTMRLVPGRSALWLHAITQVGAYIFFTVAVCHGAWLVHEVRIPAAGGSLMNISGINYHPIIGLMVYVALFFQPILGLIHHLRFMKLRRRQIWSHLHLWNGRIMIPLGIINGGLGLHIAGASRLVKTAYAVVAGVLGGMWILVAVFSEVRRRRAARRGSFRASGPESGRDDGRDKIAARTRSRAGSQSS